MRVRRTSLVGAVALVISACAAGISVSSDWDPAVDFSTYRTFVVLEEASGGGQIDQLTNRRVMAAIASTLEGKGLQQVDDPDEADAAVGWQVTTDERSSFQTVSTGWGGYGMRWGGWYGGGMGMGTSTTTERRYQVGTLVIALFDVEREEMIFTSTGSKELQGGDLSPEESQARIDEAVAEILKDFPPGGD